MRDKYQFKYWQQIFETKIGRVGNGEMGKAKKSLCDLYGRILRCITRDWTVEDRKKFSIPSRNFPRIVRMVVHICMHITTIFAHECARDAVAFCFQKSRSEDHFVIFTIIFKRENFHVNFLQEENRTKILSLIPDIFGKIDT